MLFHQRIVLSSCIRRKNRKITAGIEKKRITFNGKLTYAAKNAIHHRLKLKKPITKTLGAIIAQKIPSNSGRCFKNEKG
jgi:hypothetical protein